MISWNCVVEEAEGWEGSGERQRKRENVEVGIEYVKGGFCNCYEIWLLLAQCLHSHSGN